MHNDQNLKRKYIDIVGVTDTKDNFVAIRKREREDLGPETMVREGTVFCFELIDKNSGESIPVGENSVSALTVTSKGDVFGLTQGKNAHLFHYNEQMAVVDIACFEGYNQTARSLTCSQTGIVYGAVTRMQPGSSISSKIFSHNSLPDKVNFYTRAEKGTVNIVTELTEFGEDYPADLVKAPDSDTVFVLMLPSGKLLAVNTRNGNVSELSDLPKDDSPLSPVLLQYDETTLFAVGSEGEILRYFVQDNKWESTGVFVPVQSGKRYVAGIDSMIKGTNGLIYGGTSVDGYLFSLDPQTLKLVNLGKPVRASNIKGLVMIRDTIYGIVSERDGLAHLFRYNQDSGFSDLGILYGHIPSPFIGHEFQAMSQGRNGEILLGESGHLGHLFVYFPPVEIPRKA